jgi:hypothetical protein
MNAPVNPAPKVYAAISKVMGDIGRTGISKDRKNTQQGYQFRGIDDVYNALSGFLSAAGLCVLPRVTKREVTERASKSGGVLFYVVLDVEYDLVCAEDGSKHTVAVSGEAMDSGDKATNKAMSAAFKYACMQVFCIPTEGNPDADSESPEPAPRSDAKGDLGKNVPTDRARQVAMEMLSIIDKPAADGDHEEFKKSLAALDYHDRVLNVDEDLYVAVGEQLSASKRNVWKALISKARAAEKADRAVTNAGRKF